MSSAVSVCGGLFPRLRLDVAQVCGGTQLQVFRFVPVAGGRFVSRACALDLACANATGRAAEMVSMVARAIVASSSM